MSLIKPCVHYNEGCCRIYSSETENAWCMEGPCGERRISNGDWVRAMDDLQLAQFLYDLKEAVIRALEMEPEKLHKIGSLEWVLEQWEDGEFA